VIDAKHAGAEAGSGMSATRGVHNPLSHTVGPMRRARFLVPVLVLACQGGPAGPGGGGTVAIAINPPLLNLVPGGTGQLTATAFDGTGAQVSQATFVWSIVNSAVATVNSNGLVLGVARGTTTVTARSGSIEGSGVVNVDQAGVVSLEIVPATATTTVGGTQAFSVIARDAGGQIVFPAPTVTWSSSLPAIATIDAATGIATGVSAGATQIGPRSGAVIATPASLTVTQQSASPCDGIGQIAAFDANISYQWSSAATVGGHRIQAEHSANFVTTLTGGSVEAMHWEGQSTGTGRINDLDTDLGTSKIAKIQAAGPLLATNRPPVEFEVDPATCRYSIRVTPWLDAVFTDFDGKTTNNATAAGTLFTGQIELGAWRQLGIGEIGGLDIPAHSVVWILVPGNAALPSYLPSAFGALLWGSTAGAGEVAQGNAQATWAITIHH
jgi:Bacterial Ig-like domain (group 2)